MVVSRVPSNQLPSGSKDSRFVVFGPKDHMMYGCWAVLSLRVVVLGCNKSKSSVFEVFVGTQMAKALNGVP